MKAKSDDIARTLNRGTGLLIVALVLGVIGGLTINSIGALVLLAAAGVGLAGFYACGVAMIADGIRLARRDA